MTCGLAIQKHQELVYSTVEANLFGYLIFVYLEYGFTGKYCNQIEEFNLKLE